jgi:hypothetical protein
VIKTWQWRGCWLIDGQGRTRAQISQNGSDRFTWHTYDEDGIGGENSESPSLDDARRHCIAAVVIQGWAPGGWRIAS